VSLIDRRYTPARASPQSVEALRMFLQQELDKISQSFMFEMPAPSGGSGLTQAEVLTRGLGA